MGKKKGKGKAAAPAPAAGARIPFFNEENLQKVGQITDIVDSKLAANISNEVNNVFNEAASNIRAAIKNLNEGSDIDISKILSKEVILNSRARGRNGGNIAAEKSTHFHAMKVLMKNVMETKMGTTLSPAQLEYLQHYFNMIAGESFSQMAANAYKNQEILEHPIAIELEMKQYLPVIQFCGGIQNMGTNEQGNRLDAFLCRFFKVEKPEVQKEAGAADEPVATKEETPLEPLGAAFEEKIKDYLGELDNMKRQNEAQSFLRGRKVPDTDEILNRTVGRLYGIKQKSVGDKSYFYGNAPAPANTYQQVMGAPQKELQEPSLVELKAQILQSGCSINEFYEKLMAEVSENETLQKEFTGMSVARGEKQAQSELDQNAPYQNDTTGFTKEFVDKFSNDEFNFFKSLKPNQQTLVKDLCEFFSDHNMSQVYRTLAQSQTFDYTAFTLSDTICACFDGKTFIKEDMNTLCGFFGPKLNMASFVRMMSLFRLWNDPESALPEPMIKKEPNKSKDATWLETPQDGAAADPAAETAADAEPAAADAEPAAADAEPAAADAEPAAEEPKTE